MTKMTRVLLKTDSKSMMVLFINVASKSSTVPTYLKMQTSLVSAMFLPLRVQTVSKNFSNIEGYYLDAIKNFENSLLRTHLCSCASPSK